MAAVTPSTDLYLLQCPIEIDNRNQINFTNATAQYNYFSGLNKLVANDFTYQRKDSTIRFGAHIDDIRHYNYVMYRNDNYSNKWFYAFIEGMEYLNDRTTLIKIKTDVFQTWQFDLTYKRCFVEREHVNDDTVGLHTLDENLPTGEPIVNFFADYRPDSITVDNVEEHSRWVAQVTELPELQSGTYGNTIFTRIYNNIPQGCYFLIFDGIGHLDNMIKYYDKSGKKDAIVAMFIAPARLCKNTDVTYNTYNLKEVGNTKMGIMNSSFAETDMADFSIVHVSSLDGYVPKNNKLYCFPYSYMAISNNAGTNVIYRYEDFDNPMGLTFKVTGVLSQGCSVKMSPKKYKRNDSYKNNFDYGINIAKYPVISWVSDYYLNWQAQNGMNQAVQAGTNILKDIGTVAGGLLAMSNSNVPGAGVASTIGGAADIVSDVATAMQEQHMAQLLPDQAKGNTNCADLAYSSGKICFSLSQMTCRSEYAKMLDGFFSAYGYKINEFKIPNITGRQNWNFVKTKGSNIIANIPQEDLDEIKGMFNAGVTIWHNTATFMDYSQNNPIV